MPCCLQPKEQFQDGCKSHANHMPLHWWRSARARMWVLEELWGLLKRVSHFRDGWKLHRGSLWARPWQDGLLQPGELFIIHLCNHLITHHQYLGRAGISCHERELTLFFHESVDKPAHLTIRFLWVFVSGICKTQPKWIQILRRQCCLDCDNVAIPQG